MTKKRWFLFFSTIDLYVWFMQTLLRRANEPYKWGMKFWWPWFIYCVMNSPPNSPHELSHWPEYPGIFRKRPELEQALILAINTAKGEDPDYVREFWAWSSVEVLV